MPGATSPPSYAWFRVNDGTGNMLNAVGKEPNIHIGNAEFFDPNPACLIQIRPLLSSDIADHGVGRNCNAILFAHGDLWNDYESYVCYVRATPNYRKNNRASVLHAIERVRRNEPRFAAELDKIAARSEWPAQDNWSWKR